MEPTVKLVTYLNQHWYSIFENEKIHQIASVTTKLGIERKQFLERWRGEVGNKNADEKMYESQQKGKRIHHALYVYLNGGTVIFHPWEYSIYTDEEIAKIKSETPLFFMLKDQEEMVELWKLQQWFDAVKPQILHTEKIVYNIERNEAGTLDLAMKIEKGKYFDGALVVPETGVYIADLKTGASLDESAWSQMAVYVGCYEEKYGPVTGAVALHTQGKSKKGIPGLSTPIKTRQELKPYYGVYRHLAAVWDARNEGAGPSVFKFPSLITMKKEKS